MDLEEKRKILEDPNLTWIDCREEEETKRLQALEIAAKDYAGQGFDKTIEFLKNCKAMYRAGMEIVSLPSGSDCDSFHQPQTQASSF